MRVFDFTTRNSTKLVPSNGRHIDQDQVSGGKSFGFPLCIRHEGARVIGSRIILTSSS